MRVSQFTTVNSGQLPEQINAATEKENCPSSSLSSMTSCPNNGKKDSIEFGQNRQNPRLPQQDAVPSFKQLLLSLFGDDINQPAHMSLLPEPPPFTLPEVGNMPQPATQQPTQPQCPPQSQPSCQPQTPCAPQPQPSCQPQTPCTSQPHASCPAPDQKAENGMSFADVVTTLGRHEGLMKKALDRDGLAALRDDAKTPTDMKQALTTLLNDPAMFQKLDEAVPGTVDGKLAAGDVQVLQKQPEFKAYASALAETYTHDYVPSDAKPGAPAREMKANDAMRELYLYSESLPKKISLQTLKNIADGSQDMNKCPPQVAAAAKYFTDHPDQWRALTHCKDDKASVSRERLCDQVAAQVKLSPQENAALQTIKNNADIFFKKGGITPDKLQQIAQDSHNSQAVRDAANLLSQPNSMLFSMLDNGKHGAGGNFFNRANDHNISKGDLDAFIKKGSNQVAAAAQLAGGRTAADRRAQQDMAEGQETQPDAKKVRGGGIFKLLDIFSYIASGLSMLIPGLGEAGLAVAAGRTAISAGVKAGLEEGVEVALKAGVKTGVKDLTHHVKDQVTEMAKDQITDMTHQVFDNTLQGISGQHSGTTRVWAQS